METRQHPLWLNENISASADQEPCRHSTCRHTVALIFLTSGSAARSASFLKYYLLICKMTFWDSLKAGFQARWFLQTCIRSVSALTLVFFFYQCQSDEQNRADKKRLIIVLTHCSVFMLCLLGRLSGESQVWAAGLEHDWPTNTRGNNEPWKWRNVKGPIKQCPNVCTPIWEPLDFHWKASPTVSLAARMENGKHFRLILHIASNRTKGRNVIHPHFHECTRTRQNQLALQPNRRRLGANWHRLIVCRAASVPASLSVGAICLL